MPTQAQRDPTIITIAQPYPYNTVPNGGVVYPGSNSNNNNNYNNNLYNGTNQPYFNAGSYSDYTIGVEKGPTTIQIQNVEGTIMPVLPSSIGANNSQNL